MANLLTSLPNTESGNKQPVPVPEPGESGNPSPVPTAAWLANLLPLGGSTEQGAVKGVYFGEAYPQSCKS